MSASSAYAGQIAGRLEEYRELGRKEAAKHRPPTGATHPDTHEVALKSQADGLVSREQGAFDSTLADAGRSALDARSKLVELRSDIDQALADDTVLTRVDAELAGDRTGLVDATAARIRAEVSWRNFRAANGVTDVAHYPDSHILHWAIIVAISFGETLINAFFYRNDGGLLGGLFIALAVALVNMGSSAGLGTGFRFKNLGDPARRYAGWACLAVFLPLTLFLNALFAAFRYAFEAASSAGEEGNLGEAFQGAWAEAAGFFLGRFHFGDLSSFLLFMIGFGLSCFAFWKGYTSDDPYPGHSRRDRELKAAREAEAKRQDLVKQRIKDLLGGYRNHVQGLAASTGTMITMLSHRTSALGHAKRTLETNAASVERDYHLVLDAYRQANLAIRGTAPPDYFTDMPVVAERVSVQAAGPVEQEMKEVLDLLEQLQRQHRDDLNGKLNQLQAQTADILKSTFDDFLERVDRDAQTAVQRDVQVMPAHA